jgi:hypothetical protein
LYGISICCCLIKGYAAGPPWFVLITWPDFSLLFRVLLYLLSLLGKANHNNKLNFVFLGSDIGQQVSAFADGYTLLPQIARGPP